MIGVLSGFGVIIVVIAIGWALGRSNLLGEGAQKVIARLVFFIATPALLLETLQRSRLDQIFNANLLVQVITAAAAFALYFAIAKLWWKPRAPEAIIGGMASSYVNGGNLGIPLSVYIFGSATYVAPIMLFQVAFYAPLAMVVMDIVTGTKERGRDRILKPLVNPMLLASVVGIVLSLTNVKLPGPLIQPINLIAGMSVPGALLAFGLSLATFKSFKGTAGRHDVAVVVPVKLVFQPLLAYVLAAYVFHVHGMLLYTTVVTAALPTAQNILTYAVRYERGRVIARNSILLTTVLSIPLIVLITVLLSPHVT